MVSTSKFGNYRFLLYNVVACISRKIKAGATNTTASTCQNHKYWGHRGRIEWPQNICSLLHYVFHGLLEVLSDIFGKSHKSGDTRWQNWVDLGHVSNFAFQRVKGTIVMLNGARVSLSATTETENELISLLSCPLECPLSYRFLPKYLRCMSRHFR